MLTVSRIAASLLLISVFHLTFLAQERAPESRSAPIVTATVTAERVRFTAASNTIAMRLEVYTGDGQRLFDSGFKSGTLLDWKMLDEQGQRYPAGTYLCVVAIKSLSGRVSQKLGTLSIKTERDASFKPTETTQLSATQLQALSGAENSSALTILREGEAAAVTSIANTGTEGEITRGKGALSFRLGDFYSGKDTEQMRLTKEGNLGIGTANPQARLDVNGVIRAQEGIQFNDGTLLNLSSKGGFRVTSPSGETSSFNATTSNLSGTGTQSRLAKWTDNSGTLGDSTIFEDASGNVGIGTTTPGASLQVNGNQFVKPLGATPTYKVLAGSDPTSTVMLAMDGSNFGWQITPARSASETIVQVLGQTFAAAPGRGEFGVYLGAHSNSAFKIIRRGGAELMRVNRSGNVGIGTQTPTSKLDVAGDIRVSGTGNGIIFPDGTKQTTAGGGGSGDQMTGTSIVSAINDPATTGTISDARLSDNVARVNGSNTFNGNQGMIGNVSVTGTMSAGGQVTAPTVQSTSGGFRFPDGSVQTSAVGKVYTASRNTEVSISPSGTPPGSVAHLDLPAGNYLISATVEIENYADNFLQDNKRYAHCSIKWGDTIQDGGGFRLGGYKDNNYAVLNLHSVANLGQSASVDLLCSVPSGSTSPTEVRAYNRRLTAMKIGDVVTQ